MTAAVPLTPHPLRRVVVPIVTGIRNLAHRRFDVVPTPFIVKASSYEFGDEGATPADACASIKFHHHGIR